MERSFFSVHDFLKNCVEKTHTMCEHVQRDDGADMPLALDTVLIRTFLRAKTESLSESCLCYAAAPVFDFFFFFFLPTAKDLGLRDCPDDLFSVPKGLINLKNPTRQLKPLPKTVIRSAFSTASFLCFCCRNRSTLKDAAWHFLIQQQQGKWWGSDLGVYEFSLYSVISK